MMHDGASNELKIYSSIMNEIYINIFIYIEKFLSI